MHIQAIKFLNFVKKILPDYFLNKKILDVGSGDINGNNKNLFENCEYNGNDVAPGNNVTIVCRTKDLPFPDDFFDTIISSECFEHDPEYILSLKKIYNLLKPNGLFAFTCASTDREEHGTRRSNAGSSFGTINKIEDMMDYYKNLTEIDVDKVLDIKNNFHLFSTYYNDYTKDLYFVGIKKGIPPLNLNSLEEYIDEKVINTTKNINK